MKILLVTARYPWPAWRGDQLRASQFLRMLAPHHQVTVLTPTPTAEQRAATPEFESVSIEHYQAPRGLLRGSLRALRRGYPLQTAFHDQPALERRVVELAPDFDRVILQLVRLVGVADALRQSRIDTPLIVDLIDSLSLNFERRARFDHGLLRPLWLTEARRVARTEASMIEHSSATVVVCERDRRHLESTTGLAGRVKVVRLVVDSAAAPDDPTHQDEGPKPTWNEAGSKRCIVLTGNLGYFVNQDAVAWFVLEVWPEFLRLAGSKTDTVLQLAGARPSRLVRRLARSPSVELISAPEDLRAIVRAGTVSVAPMRAGSGVPVKILEAWAESTAVLATSWAAAGTDAVDGEHLEVASSEDPLLWARKLLELSQQPQTRQRLAESGRRLLQQRHSLSGVEKELRQVVEGAADPV